MVYAVNDLKTGDEIMWNYVDLNCPYKKRVERLQRYRFTCNCQLCELDRTDPHYEEREELLQKKATAFCRCGHSENKPYCDGAHRKSGFVSKI